MLSQIRNIENEFEQNNLLLYKIVQHETKLVVLKSIFYGQKVSLNVLP
jgi:hypothetical protein